MKKVILWVWQVPQHLLGLFLIWIQQAKKTITGNIFWYVFGKTNKLSEYLSGASLGKYIILPCNSCSEITVKHEHGHSKQSLIFGPLYILVIGLPSMLANNLWDKIFHKKWSTEKRHKWYYSRYPEEWADKLGGVVRR
jgi:hypothetical protein